MVCGEQCSPKTLGNQNRRAIEPAGLTHVSQKLKNPMKSLAVEMVLSSFRMGVYRGEGGLKSFDIDELFEC